MPEEGFEDALAEAQPYASPEAQSFVKGLLCVDPLERLTAEEALMHPFLANHDSSKCRVGSSVAKALQEFSQATPLRRVCAMAMVSSLGPEDRATVRQAFETLDVSQSGSVSIDEFVQALSFSGPPQLSREDAQKSFRSLTSNEHLSYSEFMVSMCTTLIPLREGHVQDVWRRLNSTPSKPVSVDTLQSACHGFGARLGRAEAKAMLAEVSGAAPSMTYDMLREYLQPVPATVAGWLFGFFTTAHFGCFSGLVH
jgi:Ca2+-binding EF-hand superfamily protein